MRSLFACVVIAALLGPGAAFAGKPDKHKGKWKGEGSHARLTFSPAQRGNAEGYFAREPGKGCPPGLAKKGNGCLPPGQAKKRYVVGQPIPRGVATEPLPRELSILIGPPPAGYRYVMVDGDVVQLAAGTMLVVDAIERMVR